MSPALKKKKFCFSITIVFKDRRDDYLGFQEIFFRFIRYIHDSIFQQDYFHYFQRPHRWSAEFTSVFPLNKVYKCFPLFHDYFHYFQRPQRWLTEFSRGRKKASFFPSDGFSSAPPANHVHLLLMCNENSRNILAKWCHFNWSLLEVLEKQQWSVSENCRRSPSPARGNQF